MDSEYSIQERKAIPTTKTGLSDDLVSSIESCSPLPLGYVRNVCVDGRNTIFIKPLARNVCQIIMIKSWRKVSFREKESKKEKLFQNHFLLILIYYHKPKWRRFVFLLYVYCTRCFFFFNEVQHRSSPVSIGYSAARKGRSSAAYSDRRNEKHDLL